MNRFLTIFGCIGACLLGNAAMAVSAGTTANDSARAAIYSTSTGYTNGGKRGTQGAVNAYIQNQKNTYFMVTQPDVATACSQKIMACLTEYCGDTTIVPGKTSGRCMSSVGNLESELYNYALLCLQKDKSILLPQYNTMTQNAVGGMNTAARLCPSYVQQELMTYLSMANMADKLTRSHSDLCTQRRRELEAAIACHSVALAYGNETTRMMTTQLTDYCGAGVAGGSAEMVTRFVNARNVGANVWGWADKIIGLELNAKGKNWESAVDAVLASYTNRMNLACGDNMTMNTVTHDSANEPSNLQNAVSVIAQVAFPTVTTTQAENPYSTWSIFMETKSLSEVYDYKTAEQVVKAGLGNPATTQNAFFSSAQMDEMQKAYKRGTKVFILRDSTRCFIVPVATLTQSETSIVAQSFASCISK